MPITRVIFSKDVNDIVLLRLNYGLQEIIADGLSTPASPLNVDDIELVFEEAHSLNRGKDLKILVDGNDIPSRLENLQEKSDKIAEKIGEMIRTPEEPKYGFVYITLQAGGLGKFEF